MSKLSYEERLEPGLRGALSRHGVLERSQEILMNSLLSTTRLKSVMRALDATRSVKGDTAEVGCAAGGTSLLISLLVPMRRHWACDTFEGLVDAGSLDGGLHNGAFASTNSSLPAVEKRLSGQKNITLVPGYFPKSAPAAMSSSRYAFVHIDVDTYLSIHACFEFFSKRMSPGGIIAIDDVIGRGPRGAKRAWSEILARSVNPAWQVVEQNDPQVVLRWTA